MPKLPGRISLPAAAILFSARLASAHGFIPDGHNQGLTVIDYVELGGIILASIGLIISTFWRRKPKGNPQSDDRKKAG